MTAIYMTVSPYARRARHAVVDWLLHSLQLLLHGRTVMHSLLVLHLGWEGLRLALPDDSFLMDTKQYAWFIARGSEMQWASVFMSGGAIGLAALLAGPVRMPRLSGWPRLSRVLDRMTIQPQAWRALGACAMGTLEVVFDHGLTSSGAAPTALPTYSVLTLMAFVLMMTHWFPDDGRRGRRR